MGNALELVRLGRLAPDYGASYEVVDEGPVHRLRRYVVSCAQTAPPVLLVPPLMVTSEVYDVASDTSAVTSLADAGLAPFVVDFGAPEREVGGMKRTLDDHIRAVDRSIDRVLKLTGRSDLYLGGYSQGGMFAYQACAYRRSSGVRAVFTFGAPVDIHRNVPAVHASTVGALVRALEPPIMKILEHVEGLPGELTSAGFKIISTKKEIAQRVDFVKKLHDRNALVRREARRRFLGGDGFVAWPGPALRDFVDQFIVHNRMLSGGFVIDGRTVTLADITCPILAFIGLTDDMARPASVKAISRAAPNAEIDIVEVKAGHFGLVVGSRAMRETWPTVASYVHYREGHAPRPEVLDDRVESEGGPVSTRRQVLRDDEPEGANFDVDVDLKLFVDTLTETAKNAWDRLGDVAASASDAIDGVKWREPRLRRLASLGPMSRVSASRSLADQARKNPEATFFLWHGRAFTYGEADARVNAVVKGLHSRGVRAFDRVAVVMGSRPSFLSLVSALSRLRAVAVIFPADTSPPKMASACGKLDVRFVASDPELAVACREATGREVLVLGGGAGSRKLGEGLVDMEAIDVAHIEMPADLELDGGIGRDLALVLLRPDESGSLRAAEVTHHRWALSALGAAASCTLKPEDTVYCCLPLHHPAGVLVSAGSALVAGSRLALGEPFTPETFLSEVRRYGATVVSYAGEMLRPLLSQPSSSADRNLPVRLFAGSGMRVDLWRKLSERFNAGVMEFYASTTEPLVIANASGEKVGALGRALPGSVEIAVVRADPKTGAPLRDTAGFAVRCEPDEPGLLAGRIERESAEPHTELVSGLFDEGDHWFVSHDIVRRDGAGDFWFVDSLSGFFARGERVVSTRKVEDALYGLPEVELSCAFGTPEQLALAFTARGTIDRERLTDALSSLDPSERPDVVLHVEQIPLTDGYRPRKRLLRAAGVDSERALCRWVLSGDRYVLG